MVAALSELPGIESEDRITVFLDRDAFTIEYDPALTSLEDMYEAIRGLGYTPRLDRGTAGPPAEAPQDDPGSIPQPIAGAIVQARQQDKLVFVDFYAPWCIACKALDEDTLATEAVTQALADYIVLRVDTDVYPQSAAYFGVVGMPTLLVLNGSGDELFRSVGLISAEDLAYELARLQL